MQGRPYRVVLTRVPPHGPRDEGGGNVDEQRRGLLDGMQDEGVREGGHRPSQGSVGEGEDGAKRRGGGRERGKCRSSCGDEPRDERRGRDDAVRKTEDVAQVEKVQALMCANLESVRQVVDGDALEGGVHPVVLRSATQDEGADADVHESEEKGERGETALDFVGVALFFDRVERAPETVLLSGVAENGGWTRPFVTRLSDVATAGARRGGHGGRGGRGGRVGRGGRGGRVGRRDGGGG